MSMADVDINTVLNIEKHYVQELGFPIPEGPRKFYQQMIEDGKLGRKSGKRFYNYCENRERIVSESLKRVNK